MRRGGGGEEDEGCCCCWDTLCRLDSFLGALGPKFLSAIENLRRRLSLVSFSGDGETGEGDRASGALPPSSDRACISSEACESVEVSTLGLLDREESEDIWEEC